MKERSKVIFGNEISAKAYRKAIRNKQNYVRKYGDDSAADYPVRLRKNECLYEPLGVEDIRVADGEGEGDFDTEKGLIVGNIRMGFGHYRISIAMASAAHALGCTPYRMDLNSYPDTTCTKVIGAQNDLYSLGSRLSQKSRLFNKLLWEPLNYEGFRQLTYNAGDQKTAELMAAVFKNIPKDIPVIGTHVWPAQAALHAGMQYVVNAIPDNWPMALHLAEGSTHLVQTHQAYMGYRILNGMAKKRVLKPMPADSLRYTGHYIDHELVSNVEADCDARLARKRDGKPMRFLLTIGGAGAQRELFAAVIRHLMPGLIIGGFLTVLGLITALSRVFDAVTDPLSAAFYPIVPKLVKKFGKKKLVITGFLGLALAYVIAGSIGVIGVTVIPGIVYGVLICVIAAFPMALPGIIPQSIVADVAEADGYETGENREGMFFAARTFAMKFGQSLAMLVFTSLAIIGTSQNANSNDITASVLGMTIVGYVAVGFCSLGAIILGMYNEKKVMATIEKHHKDAKKKR